MKVFRVIFSRVTFMILMILAEVLTVFFLFPWLSSNAVCWKPYRFAPVMQYE